MPVDKDFEPKKKSWLSIVGGGTVYREANRIIRK